MKNIITIDEKERKVETSGDYYTLIEINNKIYGIKAEDVLEILKVMELDNPNKLPSCILGFIKYNEMPVGVIDLREIFNSQRIVYGLSAKMLVLKTANNLGSVICDKVLDIKKLENDKIHKIPYQDDMRFFGGLYINNEENIYILNMDNILNYVNDNFSKFQITDAKQSYIADDDESKKILAERKKVLNKIKDEVQVAIPLFDRGVSFIINNIKYYINMASVKEFYKVNNSKFIKVPNTPDYIFGLINIKGDYITVIDIRKFFNTSETTLKEKSTIIILNSNEYKVGILADEICENMDIDFDTIIQNRLNAQEENKMMEFVKDDEIYQVLDVETLLRDERLTIC